MTPITRNRNWYVDIMYAIVAQRAAVTSQRSKMVALNDKTKRDSNLLMSVKG